ncbi:hypothetical protein [Hydrogenophaga sp.]|uniref:hypothetical protein n=1 Tax=Hydrogenophaga sp. TaxID=1904254 RepID=UPI003D0B7C17
MTAPNCRHNPKNGRMGGYYDPTCPLCRAAQEDPKAIVAQVVAIVAGVAVLVWLLVWSVS